MDLSLTTAQELLRDSARDFLAQECPRSFVKEVDESETGFSPELWQKMAELGWVGMILPEEYGGGGNSFMDLAVLYEEMGSACISSPHHSSAILGGLAILDAGSEQQKRDILPSVASGQRILAFAHTEPDYGWGPESINLPATRSNGGFVLNGTKLFVLDAQVADQIVVVARTSSGDSPENGVTLFLVDKNTPGVSTRNVSGWTGDKMNEVTFNNVEVPESAVIGQVDGGWPTVERVLDRGAIAMCAYIVGGLQRLLDITVEYSKNRIAFGVPIGTSSASKTGSSSSSTTWSPPAGQPTRRYGSWTKAGPTPVSPSLWPRLWPVRATRTAPRRPTTCTLALALTRSTACTCTPRRLGRSSATWETPYTTASEWPASWICSNPYLPMPYGECREKSRR